MQLLLKKCMDLNLVTNIFHEEFCQNPWKTMYFNLIL